MQVRVAPETLASGASRLTGDGPMLRGLAALLAVCGSDGFAAAGGQGRLSGALAGFIDGQQAALSTLADAAELLTQGLTAAAQRYRETELRVAGMLGGSNG